MIVNQGLTVFLDIAILSVLLRQLAHFRFSEVAFDGLFKEGLTGLLRRACMPRERCCKKRDRQISHGRDFLILYRSGSISIEVSAALTKSPQPRSTAASVHHHLHHHLLLHRPDATHLITCQATRQLA